MGSELFGMASLLVITLDVWAVVSVAGSHSSQRRKAGWIAAIVMLPVAGFAAWALVGPRQAEYRL